MGKSWAVEREQLLVAEWEQMPVVAKVWKQAV